MDIHGFAKDSVFSCEKAGENELVFVMEDTRETLEQYPFHFRFEIRYLLEKNTLKSFLWKKIRMRKRCILESAVTRDLIFRWKRDFPLRIMNWNFPGHVSRSAFFFHRSVLWRGKESYELLEGRRIPLRHNLLMKMLLSGENLWRGSASQYEGQKGSEGILCGYALCRFLAYALHGCSLCLH